jgi:myo-inositol-1(or 4)-monophosphatase
MHPLLNIAVRAARRAGDIIVRNLDRGPRLEVATKDRNDFVTEVDRAAEAEILAIIRKAYPHHGFLAEESGRSGGDEVIWIIDPLDGTTNFLHGIPVFAISIALERDGELVAGIVYNPANHETFTAEKGKGAYLNDKRLRVAARGELAAAVIGTGIPHAGRPNHELFLKELRAVMAASAGVRRMGAAALDLAWTAAGRFDGFWEHGLRAWDIAAGIVILREAGAYVTDCAGKDRMLEDGGIVAGNETIHAKLLKLLKAAGAEGAASAPKTKAAATE